MLDDDNAKDAKDLLAWMKKDEHVKIQSYIDEQYAQHRKNAILDADTSESVFRARWFRSCYYSHVREYMMQHMQKNTVADALIFMLGETALTEEEKEQLSTAMQDASIAGTDAQNIGKYVDDLWKKIWNKVSPFAQRNEKRKKEAWLKEQCTKNLSTFLLELTTHSFTPAIMPEELDSEPERKRARTLLQQVTADHKVDIESAVQKAFHEEYTANPLEIRDDPSFRHDFLVAKYFDIVQEVLRMSERDEPFVFCPEVAPDSLKTMEEQTLAAKLLKRVRAHHVPSIKQAIENELNNDIGKMSSFMSDQMRAEFRASWLPHKYFAVITKVVDSDSSHSALPNTKWQDQDSVSSLPRMSFQLPLSFDSQALSSTSTSRDSTSFSNMLTSPKRQHQHTRMQISGPRENTFVSVSDLHREENVLTNKCPILEACVLFYPNTFRYVNVKSRTGTGTESVPVISVLLADRSGPIVLDAWREGARTLLSVLQDSERSLIADALLILHVCDFDVKRDNK
eukprot:5478507-Karenia_brevis.AAC.1